MKRIIALLLLTTPASAYSGGQMQDISWQAQFAGAPSWSTFGVKDDSGVTDNTDALNSIPAGTTIIADCPNGGYVSYSGTWIWHSNFRVWQKPGCWLKSTQQTFGAYAIQNEGLTVNFTPLTNIQYYGFQFSFITPSNADRVMSAWIDHFKFKYFEIDGSGGFAFLRGSDQEIAYGTMKNTWNVAGNPGIRHFGNIPKVPTSAGMKANVWFHNLNFQTGDAAFQSCQPGSNPLTWLYNTSTDDLLYEDSYAVAGSSVILINEPVSDMDTAHPYDYYCTHITYRNISGIGYTGMIIGNSNNLTQYVQILNSDIQTLGGLEGGVLTPVIGIGTFKYGGVASTNNNTRDVELGNVYIHSFWQTALGVKDSVNINVHDVTIGQASVGVGGTAQTVLMGGNTNLSFTNANIVAGNNPQALLDGDGSTGNPSSGSNFTNINITGVINSRVGLYLGHSVNSINQSITITPANGATTATGIYLTPDPNGTHNATITNSNVSAMPIPIVCAPGQGNIVTVNTGTADCAP